MSRCYPLLFIIPILLGGCKEGKQEFRDQFRWIAGQWHGQNGSVTFIERWKWNKFRYEGEGFEIQGDDTLFREHIFLSSFNGTAAYIVSLPKQGVTSFTGREEDGRWIFENREHDFPSQIHYVHEGDSALTISLFHRDTSYIGEHSYELRRMRQPKD